MHGLRKIKERLNLGMSRLLVAQEMLISVH